MISIRNQIIQSDFSDEPNMRNVSIAHFPLHTKTKNRLERERRTWHGEMIGCREMGDWIDGCSEEGNN